MNSYNIKEQLDNQRIQEETNILTKNFQIIYVDTVPSGGKTQTYFLGLGCAQYLVFQRAEICSIKKVVWG